MGEEKAKSLNNKTSLIIKIIYIYIIIIIIIYYYYYEIRKYCICFHCFKFHVFTLRSSGEYRYYTNFY